MSFSFMKEILRKIRKVIQSAYSNSIFLLMGFSVKDHKSIDRRKIINFINTNRLARQVMDELSFDDYIKYLEAFWQSRAIAILRHSKIVGMIVLKGGLENAFIINAFFLPEKLKTKEAAGYIFNNLLKLAKKRNYSELRFWVRTYPEGAQARTSFANSEEALNYFSGQGFRLGYEICNMVLEKSNFKSIDTDSLNRIFVNRGISMRDYNKDDRDKLLGLINSEFPWWKNRMQLVLGQCDSAVPVTIIEHNKDIIAFSHHFKASDKNFELLKPTWILKYAQSQRLSDIGYRMTLGVKKQWRGQDIGSMLVCKSIEELISSGAVRIFVSSVVPAFLEKFGFVPLARYVVLAKNANT